MFELGKHSNTTNETPPALKNTSRSDTVAALREPLESCGGVDAASCASIGSPKVPPADANDVPLDLAKVHTIAFKLEDLPLKVTIAESKPKFDGDYSNVFIGLLDDKTVFLHYKGNATREADWWGFR
jgi:hypothetical protein